MSRTLLKLNLGCGNRKKEGFMGVDLYPCDAVEKVADLNGPLPFEDDAVSEVWMDNVVEHIRDLSGLFAELHRICAHGAVITVITPHFASLSSWIDPTHVHHLSYFSMDHFERPAVAHYTGGGFRVVKRKLSFSGLMGNIGRLIFKASPKAYEKTWCFIFRPGTLTFVMSVEKNHSA